MCHIWLFNLLVTRNIVYEYWNGNTKPTRNKSEKESRSIQKIHILCVNDEQSAYLKKYFNFKWMLKTTDTFLTIVGRPDTWIVRLTPIARIIGVIAKFPIKEPIFEIEMKRAPCDGVSGPVGNVLFLLSKSTRFIIAHPCAQPSDTVNKLPSSDLIKWWKQKR